MSRIETAEEGLPDTKLFASRVVDVRCTKISLFLTTGIGLAEYSVRQKKELAYQAVTLISIALHEVLRNNGLKYVTYEDVTRGHYIGETMA